MYICDICRALTGRFAIILQCPHDTECARSDTKTRDHPCNFEQRVQLAFCQVFCSLTARFNRVLQIGVWVRLSNPSVHALDITSCANMILSFPEPLLLISNGEERGLGKRQSKQTNSMTWWITLQNPPMAICDCQL